MSNTGRSIRALLAALAAAALLGGCGSTPDPLNQATGAAKKTLGLPGISFTLRAAGQTLFAPSVKLLGGKAAYDLHSGLGYEALTLQGSDGSSRKLYLDFFPGVFYAAPYPAPPGALPDGKSWIGVPLKGLVSPALVAQIEGLAPELALAEVAWGGSSAEQVGTRVVGHVPMTEYRVSVDLKQAIREAARAGRPGLAAAMQTELLTGGTANPSVTVWVNGPGYVAQTERADPASGVGTTTFSLTSFATKFNRTRPAAGQIAALYSLDRSRGSLWRIAGGS